MTVRLHIQTLVLEGLPVSRSQGRLVKAAIEAELGRLLSERGLAPGLGAGLALPSVPAAPVGAPRGGSPAALGAQIARSLFAGLGQR